MSRPGSAGRRVLLASFTLAALLLLCLGAGVAQAATCDTSWANGNTSGLWSSAGNWTNGAPDSTKTACITVPGTYTVQVSAETDEAESLTLGASSGTQTVQIQGFKQVLNNQTHFFNGSLTLDGGGSVGPHGAIELTGTCSFGACSSNQPGAQSILNIPAGGLTSAGTITFSPGDDQGAGGRYLNGSLTNTGSIDVNAPAQYDQGMSNGELENQGSITLADGDALTVPAGKSSIVFNDEGGSISNGGGSGSLTVDSSNTFIEGNGTISPATANPANPAVILDNSGYTSAVKLNYIGLGASTIVARGGASLSGNLSMGQNLIVQGNPSSAPCVESQVTAAGSFFSDGTIRLDGGCNTSGSDLVIPSGDTLTNAGTIDVEPGATRELSGNLSNAGTFSLKGSLAFDGSAATLTQTAGTTSIAGGQVLDLTGSAATFSLQGGVLTAPGSNVSTSSTLNGSLDNTGGSVIPGTLASPGDLGVVGDYTQGSGGTLTAPIHGTDAGNTYGQLGVQNTVTLAGKLILDTLPGFSPHGGQNFALVGGPGSVTGTFSSVIGEVPPEGVFPPGWSAIYQPFYASQVAGVSTISAAGLRVRNAGPGLGRITSSPAGINCTAQCDAPFLQTQTVTLTEHPGAGWVFTGWSGGCSGLAPACHVAMSQARTVTASFGHATTTRLTSSANPSKVGRTVIYTATVTPHPNGGTVRFTSGGSTISGCGAKPVNATTGRATCSVRYRSKGTRRIGAAYSGNASFGRSTSSTLTETIRKR
jgi:hypothetical protein